MKLKYFTNSRIPTEKAHGIQIMKMCEVFANHGLDVELIVPRRINKHLEKVDPFDYYQVSNNFTIKKLFLIDPTFLLKFPSGVYIKFQGTLFIIASLFYLLFNKDYNILYTRDEYLLPFLTRISKNVWHEIHNLPNNKKLYLASWKRCSKIIAITNALKDELIELGIKEDKIVVASDGVDLKTFEIKNDISIPELKKKLKLPLDKKIIIYSGHLYHWKGVDTLARGTKLLPADYLTVFLGGTDDDIKSFRQKYQNQSQILILGRVLYKNVPDYLRVADVLILPNTAVISISKLYTSPMKMFEYMAAQKPIVASNIPSLREILNQTNAVLVEPDNEGSLAEGIKRVLENEELAKKISFQAGLDVKQYSWEERAKKIL